MDTMQLPAPTRRRGSPACAVRARGCSAASPPGSPSSGGSIPVVVRVVLGAPLVTAMMSWVGLLWIEVFFGPLAVAFTQVLWLVTAGVGLAYVMGWVLIPPSGGVSLIRRVLQRRGVRGTLVKLALLVGGFITLAWFSIACLIMIDSLDSAVGVLAVLAGLLTLALLGVWMGRGGDLRDAVQRFGSPGFGRPGPDPVVPGDRRASPGPGEPDAQSTVVPPQSPDALAPPGEPAVGAAQATVPITDSVDRARAAAIAAAEAEAAWAEAERRARAEERRARRAAARAVRKERNRWGTLVAAVTMIAGGVLFLTDRLGSTALGGLGIGVICLSLLTLGVLVGAWFGSARWLILPAVGLAGILAAGSFVSTDLDQAATAAPIQVAPESLPAYEQTVMHWDSGAVTVDLTATRQLDARSLSLTVTRGSLTVIRPGRSVDLGQLGGARGDQRGGSRRPDPR